MADEIIRLEADASKAVAEFERLKASVQGSEDQISASFAEASASAEKFSNAVATGGKGAERALALTAVQIERLEAEIVQLKAQGKPTAVLEAGVESLRAKLALGTAQLGKFKAAAADAADATRKATQRAGEFSGSVTDVTNTLKTLSPTLGNAIDKYSILAAKAFVAVKAFQISAEAAKELAKATGEYNGATREAIDSASGFASALASFDFAGAIRFSGQFLASIHDLTQGISETTTALGEMADAADAKNFAGILKIQNDLVQGHKAEKEALDRKAEALSREIETQTAAGEVQKYLRDAVKETLDAYVKAGEEVPAKLAEQAAQLNIVAGAQEKAADKAAKLQAAGVQSAETRAAAETKAAAEIVAALEKETAARQKAIDDAQAALEKAQKATDEAEAGQFANSESPANAEAEKLKATIKELNALPTQTPEQVAQLDAAKEALADLNLSIRKYNIGLGESGTIAGQVSKADEELNAQRDLGIALLERSQALHDQAIDRLEQEEGGYARLSDSMQEFVDVGLKAGDGLKGTFSDAGAAATETGDAVQFLGEQAEVTTEAVLETAEAGASLGEETKKGADVATEGLKSIAEAASTFQSTLEECEVVIDRIGAKLANLKLGS